MSGYLEVKYPFKSNLGLNPFKVSFRFCWAHCLSSWYGEVMICLLELAVMEETMVYFAAKPELCGRRFAGRVLQRGRSGRGLGGAAARLRGAQGEVPLAAARVRCVQRGRAAQTAHFARSPDTR